MVCEVSRLEAARSIAVFGIDAGIGVGVDVGTCADVSA
jgi:hypothetical protein